MSLKHITAVAHNECHSSKVISVERHAYSRVSQLMLSINYVRVKYVVGKIKFSSLL